MTVNPIYVSSSESENEETENDLSTQNKSSKKSESCVIENVTSSDDLIVYSSRWGVLISAFFLNLSNGAIWSNCSPVATDVADYYDKSPEAINWFSLVFLIATIPGAFYGTYIVDRWGLRPTLWIGCTLNLVGALIRALSTSSVFTSDRNAQYAISLFGQVLCANSENFVFFMGTKISQSWFPERQRGISTTLLAMANTTGILVAQVSVPFIVQSEDDVPLNDLIFLGDAAVTACLVYVFVRRSTPSTPPSHSADALKDVRPPYLEQLKIAFTCKAYWLLVLAIGGGIGFVVTSATLTQQILCPLGYTEAFSGIVIGLMVLFGFAGAFCAGIVLDRTKMYTEITISLFGLAALSAIVFCEFLLVADQGAVIVIFAILFGTFGLGLFPVGLELAVEATYPVEESITFAFIFLAGQIMGIILILLIPALGFEMADQSMSLCSTDGEFIALDYTISITVAMILLGVLSILPIAFFKTEYKRQNAEIQMRKLKEKKDRFRTDLDEDRLKTVLDEERLKTDLDKDSPGTHSLY